MQMAMISQLSVISLLIEMRFNETLLATATAFVVNSENDKQILITNRHNVTGMHNETGKCLSSNGGIPNNLVAWHNAKMGLGNWISVRHELYHDDKPLWIEHPSLKERADFVGLIFDPPPEYTGYPVDLGTPNPDILVGPADTVSVIGFPFGLSATGRFGIWATGFMASEPDFDQDGLPLLYIDCRSRQGQSGSPVFAHRNGGLVPLKNGNRVSYGGEVWAFLGIYSGRINSESDIGRVWKRGAIAELVASIA